MRLAIALALAAVAAVPAPAQAGPAFRGAQMVPLRTDTQGVVNELDLARRARLNLVKVDISWAELEPAPGEYSEAYLDRIADLTRAAAKRRMRVLLLLQATPCWASTGPEGSCDEGGSSHPPSDFDAYGRAAGLLAERFGARLAAIEVWNEPDHENEQYWKADDKAGDYVRLVKSAYAHVKDANPRVQVLAGSLVGASGEFLQQLYDAGMKGHYDGISVHYYDLVLASLRSLRATQSKNRDRKPLWLTEFGFTSCHPQRRQEEGHTCVSRREQGTFLIDIFQALRATSWVRAAVVYNMRDTEQYKFGLASPTFEPKPALLALAKAFSRSRIGPPRRVKVRETRRGVRVTAPVGDVMKLQAYKGPCSRQSAGSRPRFEDLDAQLVRGRVDWRQRALTRGSWCIYAETYWTGRKALADVT